MAAQAEERTSAVGTLIGRAWAIPVPRTIPTAASYGNAAG